MFLSIIVPVYNAQHYLQECLHSLLTQDIPETDYEVICVNDGSTDGSGKILAEFAAEHSNLLIIDQENSGVVTARNVGLSRARGDYVWFVDADDLIAANVLARLRGVIQDTDCDRLVVDGYQFEQVLTSQQQALARQGNLPDNVPGLDAVVWRSLIRRSFLLRHNITFRHPELTHGEDGQFMYELSMESPSMQEIGDTVYFYRIRPGSAETADSADARAKRLRSHIAVSSIMLDCYQSNKTHVGTANRLMNVLWNCLYDAARLPLRDARRVLSTLKHCGLFPFRRPKSCTLIHSYVVSGDGFVEKVFDWVYIHMHTRPGFALMWILYHLSSAILSDF